MLTRSLSTLVLASALILFASPSQASKRTLSIPSTDVETFTPSDETLGKYYTLAFRVPDGIAALELERAVLEFYVDVQAKSREGYTSTAMVIEAYALKADFSGTVDLADFETSYGSTRPVATGDRKRVKLDVTRIVRSYIANPSRNHGLILGSLGGIREGDFTVKTGQFRDGSVAQLHLYYAIAAR